MCWDRFLLVAMIYSHQFFFLSKLFPFVMNSLSIITPQPSRVSPHHHILYNCPFIMYNCVCILHPEARERKKRITNFECSKSEHQSKHYWISANTESPMFRSQNGFQFFFHIHSSLSQVAYSYIYILSLVLVDHVNELKAFLQKLCPHWRAEVPTITRNTMTILTAMANEPIPYKSGRVT